MQVICSQIYFSADPCAQSDLTATNRHKCFEILKYLLENPTHRVAEHAAKALVPLIDASDKAEVVPHLGEIVSG